MNIVMAAHVGDITQTEHDEEWKIADAAFKTIDNHVPYILCSGNHDMGYSPQHHNNKIQDFVPPPPFPFQEKKYISKILYLVSICVT